MKIFSVITRLLWLLSFWETIIGKDKLPYLRRYHIFKCRWFNIYVHQIFRSDEDRDLHDHPWNFTSIIMLGAYLEETLDGSRLYTAGSIVRHQAEDAHRLVIPVNTMTWTFVITGRKRRDWGFRTATGWVPWRTYIAAKFGTVEPDEE